MIAGSLAMWESQRMAQGIRRKEGKGVRMEGLVFAAFSRYFTVQAMLILPQKYIPPHQAFPQANPLSIQDHTEFEDLTKTAATYQKTAPNEARCLL